MSILACHGSPESLTEGLYEDTREGRFLELAEKHKAEIVICGHTHVGFQKEIGGVMFVNCGSVGKSGDGDPRASYACIEAERDATGLHMEVTLRRVKYDVETAAKVMVRRGIPHEVADRLREGK
jgi:diadenosine tetraphosphatase ApaH/serine/threonine PP2A family protein phosphatase